MPLTVADIRSWTEERFYDRGESYARQDRIEHPQQIEGSDDALRIEAMCQGSRPEPYRLHAVIRGDSIAESHCSCPAPPRCKHLVALLITWIDDPDRFLASSSLSDRLHEQPKAVLVDLIQEMIEQHPSLTSLVDLHTMQVDAIEEEAVRTFVRRALQTVEVESGYGDRPPDVRPAAREIESLVQRGRALLAENRLEDAATVLETITTTMANRYETVYDPEGDLLSVGLGAARGLADLLSRAEDDALRMSVLRSLYDSYRWDLDLGGADLANPALHSFREETTSAERDTVAEWMQTDLDALQPDPSGPRRRMDEVLPWSGYVGVYDPSAWKREALGEALLDLCGDDLSDEEVLDICKRADLTVRRAERLVAMGRLDDAIQVAEEARDFELPGVLDHLVEAGREASALVLAHHRLDPEYAALPVARWLYDHAMAQGDHEEALQAAATIFRQRPVADTLDLARSAARPLDREDEVVATLLDDLRDDARLSHRAQLSVYVGDTDRALSSARTILEHDIHSWSDDALLAVADFLRDRRPDAAVEIYDGLARRCIQRRDRSNYRFAASVLTHARSFLTDVGRTDDWTALIETLVDDELHRLPAARDEFEKHNLLQSSG